MTVSNCETAFRFLIVYTPSRAEYQQKKLLHQPTSESQPQSKSAKYVMHYHAEYVERVFIATRVKVGALTGRNINDKR